MALIPVYLRSFEREVEKAKKRGLDIEKLKEIMTELIEERPLATKNRNQHQSTIGDPGMF